MTGTVSPPPIASTPVGPPALALRQATLGYNGRPVVFDADLVVHHGEVVALLGANGSGKTTLVRGLVGLAEVLHGAVEVSGTTVSNRSARTDARVGYVPQRLTAVAGIPTTAAEVVASGLLAGGHWWTRHSRTRIRAALGEIGLAHLAATPVEELSGGQQRRVLIARALVADPQILLLDEPTAGVDRAGVASLVAALTDLKAAGRTLLVVTHDVGAFSSVVDRVATMVDGHLSAGPPRPDDPTGSH